jgi:hypothetical protein
MFWYLTTLFNCRAYIASNWVGRLLWMWKGKNQKRAVANCKVLRGFRQERLRKPLKIAVSIAGNSTEIRKVCLPNTCPQSSPLHEKCVCRIHVHNRHLYTKMLGETSGNRSSHAQSVVTVRAVQVTCTRKEWSNTWQGEIRKLCT